MFALHVDKSDQSQVLSSTQYQEKALSTEPGVSYEHSWAQPSYSNGTQYITEFQTSIW